MSFYFELLKKFDLLPEEAVGGDAVRVLNGRYVVVEGHRGVLSYAEDMVVVRLKKAQLRIVGKQLSILEVNEDEVLLGGVVEAISRE